MVSGTQQALNHPWGRRCSRRAEIRSLLQWRVVSCTHCSNSMRGAKKTAPQPLGWGAASVGNDLLSRVAVSSAARASLLSSGMGSGVSPDLCHRQIRVAGLSAATEVCQILIRLICMQWLPISQYELSALENEESAGPSVSHRTIGGARMARESHRPFVPLR